MNEKQKKLLFGIAIIIGLMLLYPPFNFKGMNGIIINLGYSMIFNPPTHYSGHSGSVDVGVLITQWLGTLIAGGIGFFLLKNK